MFEFWLLTPTLLASGSCTFYHICSVPLFISHILSLSFYVLQIFFLKQITVLLNFSAMTSIFLVSFYFLFLSVLVFITFVRYYFLLSFFSLYIYLFSLLFFFHLFSLSVLEESGRGLFRSLCQNIYPFSSLLSYHFCPPLFAFLTHKIPQFPTQCTCLVCSCSCNRSGPTELVPHVYKAIYFWAQHANGQLQCPIGCNCLGQKWKRSPLLLSFNFQLVT